MSKQKLELTWIRKEKRPKLEPRILLEDPDKSFHANRRFSDGDVFDNREGIHAGMAVLDEHEIEWKGECRKRAARFRHDRGDLDRPLAVLEAPAGERCVADIEDAQRRLRCGIRRPRPLQRTSQHGWQLR